MPPSRKPLVLFFGIIGLGLALSLPARAQMGAEPIGSVEATLNGEPYRGQTLFAPTHGTATAELRRFGPIDMISIQAHDPEADSVMRNVFYLAGTLTGEGASASLAGPEISYFPDGMRGPLYLSDTAPAEAAISLEAFSFDGDTGTARGTFTAYLCKRDSIFDEMDTEDCLAVEGAFDTLLHKSEI